MAALVLMTTAAASMAAPPPATPPVVGGGNGAPVAGGWSDANPASAGVRAAAQAAVAQLPAKGATLARIESAEQQVVAGMNYHLILALGDGQRWDVTVWARLGGAGHQLTGATRLDARPGTPRAAARPALRLLGSGLELRSGPGVGEAIPFGTAQADVLAALAFRGKAQVEANDECGFGPAVIAGWPDGLNVLFHEGRFQGWSLDSRSKGIRTGEGVGIGSTLAQLRAKGRVQVTRSTLGIEFTAIHGLSGTLGAWRATGRVTNMWAGLACVMR